MGEGVAQQNMAFYSPQYSGNWLITLPFPENWLVAQLVEAPDC